MIKERDDKDRATEEYISPDLEIKTSKTYILLSCFWYKGHIFGSSDISSDTAIMKGVKS